MAIETFAQLQTSTVRSDVSINYGGNDYRAFLVSTYVNSEDESVDVKIAESLEYWSNSQWSYFYLNLELQQWATVEGSPVNVSITLGTPSPVVNEGDLTVTNARSLRTAVDRYSTPVYGVWQEDEAGEYSVAWFNLDNSSYTGDAESLVINQNEEINNSATLWYADLRTDDNKWLLLYQVISTDASGNILQAVYMQENGQVFNAYDYSIAQNTTAYQTTEVYQLTTSIDESLEIDVNTWIQEREVIELTLNIVTPWSRKGKGRSALVLGRTRQVLPLGRKGYFDRILPGHRIRTIPKVELANGSRLDCDLRFSTAAIIVRTLPESN